MTEIPNAHYRFPPLVRPAASVETTMARLDAQANLVMERCTHRTTQVEIQPRGSCRATGTWSPAIPAQRVPAE
jgi:hypothetical protein